MTIPASRSLYLLWLPVIFVPLVAWVKDASVLVLALSLILILAQPDSRRAALAAPKPTWVLALAAAFVVWSLASFAWAPSPTAASWLKAFATIAMTALAVRGLSALPEDRLDRVATLVVIGTVALFTLLLCERITGGFLIGLRRVAETREKHFNIMSAGLALLTCLSYPTTYLLWRRSRGLVAPGIFLVAVFGLGLSYRMDAAPIGIAAGFVAGLCVMFARRRGFVFVTGGLAILALMWGVAAAWAWRHGLETWLSAHATTNWGLRVEIWDRVHELIRKRSLTGYGFDAARVVGEPGVIAIGDAQDVRFLHPHNGLLQIWLELGAVGVALFIAWAGTALHVLHRSAPNLPALVVATASLAAVAVFWEVSFGIWQGWWLAAIGLTCCAVALVFRVAGRDQT